ncbi:MAG: M56 family metallopeptidase [Bacteroidales bacterium]
MMESFTIYLFKSAMWLSGFGLIYFLFLRNEKFFILKRYYLLLGLVTSVIFPFISVKYQVEIPAPAFFVPKEHVEYSYFEPGEIKQFNYKQLLLFFYCTGVIFLIIKLMTQLNSIYKIIRRSAIERFGNAKLVCTDKVKSPFSFFNYIFISPSIRGKEKEMIMNHELVHVKHKHWIDLVLTELVRLIQWINPVVWVYASFIRQNNEYIADETALKHISDPAIYQATLLNQLFDSPLISLSNSFSYSLNKKRFEMMKTTIRSPYRKARILFVLPVFALLIFAFAEEKYVYSSQPSATEIEVQETSDKTVSGVVYDSKGNAIPGAIVIITGTTSGTVTDMIGNFKLDGVAGDGSLTVASEGFKSRTIKVENKTEFTIALIGEDEEILPPPPPPPSALENSELKPPPPPPPPLVFVDGVQVHYSEIEKINPADIILMRGLPGDKAVERYGENAKDGIIEILTKRESAPQSASQSDPEPQTKSYVSPVEPPIVDAAGNPLPKFVDGVLTPEPVTATMDIDQIYSVEVVKDSQQLVPYGDIGKNGVVLITTVNDPSLLPEHFSKVLINHRPFSSSDRTLGVKTEIGKTPLYIVDGVTIENFDHYKIDPDVIESISVLKDKSATELYGEKAKNGVVIIKTKRE